MKYCSPADASFSEMCTVRQTHWFLPVTALLLAAACSDPASELTAPSSVQAGLAAKGGSGGCTPDVYCGPVVTVFKGSDLFIPGSNDGAIHLGSTDLIGVLMNVAT